MSGIITGHITFKGYPPADVFCTIPDNWDTLTDEEKFTYFEEHMEVKG